MRILRLTTAVEKQLLRMRQNRDTQAERIAAHIVGDVRRRGDLGFICLDKKAR